MWFASSFPRTALLQSSLGSGALWCEYGCSYSKCEEDICQFPPERFKDWLSLSWIFFTDPRKIMFFSTEQLEFLCMTVRGIFQRWPLCYTHPTCSSSMWLWWFSLWVVGATLSPIEPKWTFWPAQSVEWNRSKALTSEVWSQKLRIFTFFS